MDMKFRLRENVKRWIAVIVIVTLMSGMSITLRAQENSLTIWQVTVVTEEGE